MRVRPCETERADTRDRRLTVLFPQALALLDHFPPQAGPTECGVTGSRKWRCCGSNSFSSERTTLMTPAIPAAASRWPMLVFVRAHQQRLVRARVPSPNARTRGLGLDRVAERRPCAVRLEVVDVTGFEALRA